MGYGGKQASRSGDIRRFNFTGNGSNTAFDLGFTPATQNQLIVTINGGVQHYDAFSVTGSTINFTGTPAAGDAIQVTAVVDTVGVSGIPNGAVANVSTLNVSGAATFANTTTHTGVATFSSNVGVGTTTPVSALHVNVDGGQRITLSSASGVTNDEDMGAIVWRGGDGTGSILGNVRLVGGPNGTSDGTAQLRMGARPNNGNTSYIDTLTLMSDGTIVANGTIQRTLTGDAIAIKVVGSYNGNTLFEVGQSASDGYVAIRDAQGNAAQLTGYPSGSTILRGKVTNPELPAFSMYANANVNGGVIPFSGVKFNNGSYFNTTTYAFTAPVAGYYLFSFYGNVNNISSGTGKYGWFRKNGSQVGSYIYMGSSGGWDLLSGTELIKLAVNDSVDVFLNSTGHADWGTNWSSFSGHLVG